MLGFSPLSSGSPRSLLILSLDLFVQSAARVCCSAAPVNLLFSDIHCSYESLQHVAVGDISMWEKRVCENTFGIIFYRSVSEMQIRAD